MTEGILLGCLFAAGCGSPTPSRPDTSKTPVEPRELRTFAAGDGFVCGRTSSDGVACWGKGPDSGGGIYNSGDTTAQSVIPGVSGVRQIAASNGHACALTTSDVWCWGSSKAHSFEPAVLVGLGPTKAISLGAQFVCALLTTGTVKCVGGNFVGELGSGPGEDSSTPVEVPGLTDIVQITSGTSHSCALSATGSVRCWGLSSAVGDGKKRSSTGGILFADPAVGPVGVKDLSDAVEVDAGMNHTCAVRRSGSIVCWGDNFGGALGNGSTKDSAGPVHVKGIDDAIHVAAGSFSCATHRDGAVSCWGNNSFGELRTATTKETATRPVQLDITARRGLDVGQFFACAKGNSDQEFECWGYNGSNELGDADQLIRTGHVTVS